MRAPLEFTDEEDAAIEEARRHAPTWRERRRAEGIRRWGRGESAESIAQQLEASIDSVRSWYWRWRREGIACLRDQPRPGRPRKLLPADEQHVCERASEAPHSAQELYELLKADHPHAPDVHLDTIKDVLRRHRFRYKRTRASLKKTRPGGIWVRRPGA